MSIVTADEAETTRHQHVRPCGDCPWRRSSIAGWLGSASADDWIAAAHGESCVECHALRGADEPWQCAGVAAYRSNVAKLCRDPDVLRLGRSLKVFGSPLEFRAHHAERAK